MTNNLFLKKQNAYILGGLRSFVGVVNGIYRHIPAENLGAEVLNKLVQKYKIDERAIDFIIGGNGVGAGGNITRLMMLKAGINSNVPAFTIDVQCGSGLESIAVANAKILAGEADLIIAGGFESSSTQPQRSYNKNHPDYKGENSAENFYSVAKFVPNIHRETVMIEGAELTAVKEHITKAEMDKWVLKSHALATKAQRENLLKDIVVSVCNSNKDEGIRPKMSQKLLDRMGKILPNGKYITPANACLINDGASFVIICSERYINYYNLNPVAKIIGATSCGGNPLLSPKTAITALEKLFSRYNLEERDIDSFEINEAFAVIDVLFERRFAKSVDKYNIFGGALAYGHPYGASGSIILLHLIESLKRQKGNLGCCSVAAAGGVGTALLIERV